MKQIYSYNNGIRFLRSVLPLLWCKTVPDSEIIPLDIGYPTYNVKLFAAVNPTAEINFTVAFGYQRLARLFRISRHRVPDGKHFQLYVRYPTSKLKVLPSGTRCGRF